MEKKFKAFDRVLTKYGKVWVADIYSNYIEENKLHLTLRGTSYDSDILPYEGNEHLVGTTDSPDEEVMLEEGEYLVCFDCMDYFEAKDFCLSPFNALRESTVRTKDGNNWNLFIRFKDFDPSNMEETKKHILCVKNGKIVKYKNN